ncbi:MAG: AMP-binding protein [Bacteroidales bacterium]|nr:AMP-binding protein [Bacteroidales bacterium]
MLNSKTLHEVLNYSIKAFANNPFLAFVGEKPYTFSEFYEKLLIKQDILINQGIGYQDKAVVLGENSPAWAEAYLAIVDMGAIAVPLLPEFTPEEITTCINHSDSKLVFVSKRYEDKIILKDLKNIETVVSLEDNSILFSKEINNKGVKTIPSPEDLAVIIYTSGTTGYSKGVMLTHSNLAAQLVQVHHIHTLQEDDVYLSLLPLSHTLENSLCLLTALMHGSTVYFHNKLPVAKTFMESVKIVRPTTMLSVPLLIEKAYKTVIKPELEKTALRRIMLTSYVFKRIMYRKAAKKLYEAFGGRLRFFGIGGAKLDGETELFLRLGRHFPYAIGYGLTETAPLIIGANPKQVSWQTIGYPLVDVDVRLGDINPQTMEGEIQVKGPNVMKGYYKEEELTAMAFTPDGYLRTGDLAIEKDGRYEIKGRIKNVIVGASGENIYPEEIEMIVNQNKLVLESIVVERKGKLIAMVQFNEEELMKRIDLLKHDAQKRIEIISEELLNSANQRLNRFSRLSLVVEAKKGFEKTATLKIKRHLYK